jgi:excisionase family DNA binding protein
MSATETVKPAPVAEAVSVPAAARRLKVNEKTLRKAIALGEVKAVKLAGAIRIPLAELERLLAAKV